MVLVAAHSQMYKMCSSVSLYHYHLGRFESGWHCGTAGNVSQLHGPGIDPQLELPSVQGYICSLHLHCTFLWFLHTSPNHVGSSIHSGLDFIVDIVTFAWYRISFWTEFWLCLSICFSFNSFSSMFIFISFCTWFLILYLCTTFLFIQRLCYFLVKGKFLSCIMQKRFNSWNLVLCSV